MCINALGNGNGLVFMPETAFLLLKFVLGVQFYFNSRCRILIYEYRDFSLVKCRNDFIKEIVIWAKFFCHESQFCDLLFSYSIEGLSKGA